MEDKNILENKSTENETTENETTNVKVKEKLNGYQILSIVLASILVALALGVGIYFIIKNAQENKNPNTLTPLESRLTEENYNKITVGMTYEQVFAIMGEGKRTDSEDVNSINIVWQGNNSKIIVVTFSVVINNKGELVPNTVTSKAQSGIINETLE